MILPELDNDGFLANLHDWNPAVAEQLAAQESITLTPAHWEILNALRDFYAEFDLSPAMRPLTRYLKEKTGGRKSQQHLPANPLSRQPCQGCRPYCRPAPAGELPVSHHPLADYVRILARGKNASRSMSFDEARFTMQSMLRGDYLPEQLGAILMLLRVKEESPEEVAGFAAAINEYWPADVQADLIWASYAGKRRQPFWCLLSALLLSQMGYRILFHGSEAHTEGRLYLHELFRELQWPVVRDLKDLQQSAPLRYLPCSVLHPELQRWLLLKSILGVRSPINTVLKTIAPPGIASVQGVFHPNYAAVHQQGCGHYRPDGGDYQRRRR